MSKNGEITNDVSMGEPNDWGNLPVHPFVELLVARMESHPQEFFLSLRPVDQARPSPHLAPNAKWTEYNQIVERCRATWNRREKWLYNNALRAVRLQEAHETLMRKLLA